MSCDVSSGTRTRSRSMTSTFLQANNRVTSSSKVTSRASETTDNQPTFTIGQLVVWLCLR